MMLKHVLASLIRSQSLKYKLYIYIPLSLFSLVSFALAFFHSFTLCYLKQEEEIRIEQNLYR